MLGAKAVACAKINLFLDVGELEADGYHQVRSVMQSLHLADELYFRRTEGSGGRIVIRCSDSDLPAGEENIIWSAVETFASETGIMKGEGIEVFLNKKIPVGAGLAGGSADAAATILAMDYIWELDLPPERHVEIGSKVGSDVPFCLKGGTALVTGRGEIVDPLEPLPPYQVVLASPGMEVSTGEVYRRFDELSEELRTPAEGATEQAFSSMLEGIRNQNFGAICAGLHNSLESATIAKDKIEEYKNLACGAGAEGALMTGSGPTVFALVSGLEAAAEVAWELEKTAPVTIITSFSQEGVRLSV